jgi:hypothetical protein
VKRTNGSQVTALLARGMLVGVVLVIPLWVIIYYVGKWMFFR